jgi:hypothetical protein
MAVDGLLGIDRLVSHRGVDVLVADQELGDVWWHSVHDGVGDEDSSEVVGQEPQGLAVGAGQAGQAQRGVEQVADTGSGDRAVLGAHPSLEQDRHRWVEHPLVVVVGADQRDRAGVVTDPGNDGAEHVGQLR